MKPDERGPFSFNEAFLKELRELRPDAFPDLHAAKLGEHDDVQAANLKKIYEAVHGTLNDPAHRPLAALCFSGGGIRSATFNLGVLQGLARIGVLSKFDYLSSVSGGGYISGWLAAWRHHARMTPKPGDTPDAAEAKVFSDLAEIDPPGRPLAPEPKPLDHLREYSNFLTPRTGTLSVDLWSAVAIVLRNLLLNWTMLLPVLAALVAIPQLCMLVVQAEIGTSLAIACMLGALVTGLLAEFASFWMRTAQLRADDDPGRRPAYLGHWAVVAATVGLLWISSLLTVLAAAWAPLYPDGQLAVPGAVLPFALIWLLFSPLLGWAVAEFAMPTARGVRRPFWPELSGLVISGFLAALLLEKLYDTFGRWLISHPALFVAAAIPTVLMVHLLARAFFVGWSSLGEGRTRADADATTAEKPVAETPAARKSAAETPAVQTTAAQPAAPNTTAADTSGSHTTAAQQNAPRTDAPRTTAPNTTAPGTPAAGQERAATGVPAGGAAAEPAPARIPRPAGIADMDREWWARLSGWVLLAALTWLIASGLVLAAAPLVERLAAYVAGMGGLAATVVAVLGKSGATKSGRRDDSEGSPAREWALRLAVPLLCVATVILLALGTTWLGRAFSGNPELLEIGDRFEGEIGIVRTGDIISFILMMAVLAGLGALMAAAVSVNRFSLQGLYRTRLVRAYLGASNPRRKPDPFTGFDPRDDFPLHEAGKLRPLPVLHAALNLVRGGEHLAWQQRKAESFSMSPFYCGNFHDGYRDSRYYGGREGIRLGTAMSISGAAANPNMGYHSSPAVTFLLTLLNARLGSWLGNPGEAGEKTFRHSGPRWALRPILAELFGHTDSRSPYVNLSDGGHFENLGLYEMVLRRCKYIVVSDAGQDPKATFDDLGNAIRKVRIDFRIPIEFDERIHISPRENLPTGLFCAKARIRYSAVDEGAPEAVDGMLLYLKPALYGRGRPVPYDVWSYAGASPLFPHESTADQWFDESQFESYRALGLHVIGEVTSKGTTGEVPDLFRVVDEYLKSI
jgi:hypothetical protein